MGRYEFVIIPKEIEEKILQDFFKTENNSIRYLSEKYGYSQYKINKLIEQNLYKL
jgi:hypothetical protein